MRCFAVGLTRRTLRLTLGRYKLIMARGPGLALIAFRIFARFRRAGTNLIAIVESTCRGVSVSITSPLSLACFQTSA